MSNYDMYYCTADLFNTWNFNTWNDDSFINNAKEQYEEINEEEEDDE